MKYLETEHERKSFAITTVIFILILILCFFLGMSYIDPPPENGIAINFGTTEFGSGEVQPTEPIASAPQQVQSATQSTPVTDEVATQDIDDAPVISNKKPQKDTPREDTKPKEAPKPTPSKSTTDALNNIINGPKSDGKATEGQGNDSQAGDKGRIDGDINSDGDGKGKGQGSGRGTGIGNYQLAGRNALTKPKPAGCNEFGQVTIQITVDASGNVVKAETSRPTNASPCLINQAKAAALKTKWDEGTAEKQVGKITYNFTLTE